MTVSRIKRDYDGVEFRFQWLSNKVSLLGKAEALIAATDGTDIFEGATIHVNSEGELKFTSGKPCRLSYPEWSKNHGLVESALEDSYKNPVTSKRNRGIKSSIRNYRHIKLY